MQLKQLFDDEDAVSPVIGVILMVAITVILAAVIGTFVLGLGDQVQSSAPNANFQFSYGDFSGDSNADDIQITHNGGQDVQASQVEVQVGSGGATAWNSLSSPTTTGVISTGDSAYVDGGAAGNAGSTVRVIWTSSNGGSSNTIGSSTVPN